MGKVDYNQVYQLQRQVNRHRSSISSAKTTIATIDEKLQRLRSVKKSIGNIQRDVNDIKVSVMLKKINQIGKARKRMISKKVGMTFQEAIEIFKQK